MSSEESRHVVVVVGGAVAGSEAASVLVERGVDVVVLEQNDRPYGKIEDGLPRWHTALRNQEYAKIDSHLSNPRVRFVPRTRLGKDIRIENLLQDWGVSAVILANGAWRDRSLGVPGVDEYIGKGLVYQNSFVYWFNHYREEGYAGPVYEASDNAIVIGGGLASIDVVKVLNLEVYGRALRARGIAADMHEMERAGIGTVLAKHGLTADALGVRGCTLYYRRRKCDMPLAQMPDNATPEQVRKTETVREKVMDVCIKKYLVRFEECHMPVAVVAEGGRLAGLKFRRTEVVDGKLKEVAGSDYEVRGSLVVSSIGSIPEPIPDVPMKGELYQWANWETGALSGYDAVVGLGNVLTGKGNIKASRENSQEVAHKLALSHLGFEDERAAVRHEAEAIAERAKARPKMSSEGRQRMEAWIAERYRSVGYPGTYSSWMTAHAPKDAHE